MGVMPSAKSTQQTPNEAKRRSAQLDFSNIGPLKTAGTVGFSTFRDQDAGTARQKTSHKRNASVIGATMDEDSEEDEDEDRAKILGKIEDTDDKDVKSSGKLAPEDAKFSGELADGVNRIRVCLPAGVPFCPRSCDAN